MSHATLYVGNALDVLRTLPGESIQCCVTSPPYWGLRDFGERSWMGGSVDCHHDSCGQAEGVSCSKCGAWYGQLGLEPRVEQYVDHVAAIFDEVRRVLRPDGVLWLNLGDCHNTQAGRVGEAPGGGPQGRRWRAKGPMTAPNRMPQDGLKPKDLVGVPWLVAFELRARGWWLRQCVVWQKPNCMPESTTDRPTTAHEYLFLMSKAARYYYDGQAIAEPGVSGDSDLRKMREKKDRLRPGKVAFDDPLHKANPKTRLGRKRAVGDPGMRNARSVWTIPTVPYPEAHYATFPPELPRRCILAGSRPGDLVLDPFGGTGTVAAVAVGNGRQAIHIDLNPEYLELARQRIGPLLCELAI